jgi:glyoxylase-like metal-dependent hydrolase (beta-lactamase superfamily II)
MYKRALLAAVACAGVLAAQYQDVSRDKAGRTATLKMDLLATGVYMISGPGGNAVLRLTGNGLILVDGQRPGSYRDVFGQTQKISDQLIRFLIVTSRRPRDTGGIAKFLDAHTQVIAQQNLKTSLAATLTYDRDYAIKLGGVEAQVRHFGNAHSNGDTVVYFPGMRIVAVGDLFTSGTPDVDYAAGGSLTGWGPVLGEILKLDFDTVVPGAGPAATRADLEAFKLRLEKLIAHGTELVRKGVPKNRILSALKGDDPAWPFNFTGAKLDSFYAELAGTK